LEESLAEAFTLRGMARLADSWEQEPLLAEYSDYAKHLRRYRELTIAPYRSGSSPDALHWWFGGKRVELENDIGGRITTGPVLLMILGELDRDIGCVADLGALNRWPSRAAAPFEDYLRLWEESCAELSTPGSLPRRIKDVLFFDEPAPLDYRRPVQPALQHPNRGKVCQQVVPIDDLVALDHPVRAVWKFSESLDLGFLADASGAPAKPSPTLIFSIWLWAAAEGIGSARHIARLCEQHVIYRWLCGGVSVDHQMLVEVRAANQGRLELLLSHSLAALVQERVLTTGLVPMAALKNLGLRDRSTPQERLKVFAAAASTRVQQLREVLDRDDPVADEYHMRTIANSAVQEQEERVTMALGWMKEIDGDDDSRAPSKPRTRAPSKPRTPRRLDKGHRRRTSPTRRRAKLT
jgi:transposase